MKKHFKKIELKRYISILIILLIISLFHTNDSLAKTKSNHVLKIALSTGSINESNERYIKWLHSINPNVVCVDIYPMKEEEESKLLKECSGLLLTGGDDVCPAYYGKPGDTSRVSMELPRDTLEFYLIKKAAELKLPVLGVCRGMQILNVAYGGSLIVDIPTDYKNPVIHRCDNPKECFHDVIVNKKTLIYKLTHKIKAKVNTNHHQAVDKLAERFVITARATDGIPETMELKEPSGKPFMLAVQWHPERLGKKNIMSGPIGKYFLAKAKDYLFKKKRT
ncbi:MAG: gamma-glutamyl-gamma-aminobutyrate hydrolase family protein [FCB group bacterium]|jgi:putative glutamine amidotransferase